jgi:hypothetical protein
MFTADICDCLKRCRNCGCIRNLCDISVVLNRICGVAYAYQLFGGLCCIQGRKAISSSPKMEAADSSITVGILRNVLSHVPENCNNIHCREDFGLILVIFFMHFKDMVVR